MSAPVYTAEFVERGYNNRAAVPDHPQWFARWAALAADARRDLEARIDVRYGPNPLETLDLFVPAQRAHGTLVFIHGGYWRALDKSDFSFVATRFVERGYAVAVINYDLCPSVSIDTIVEECRRAVAWVVREGTQHGASGDRVVVSGHSAGGHLAAMLLATPARSFGLERHPLSGAVSLSGVHDLRPMTLFSFNVDLKLDESSAVKLSPILRSPASDARIVAAVGADETSEFLRQTQLLWDAWPANRPERATGPLIIPNRHHFSVVVDYADRDSTLVRQTLALLA